MELAARVVALSASEALGHHHVADPRRGPITNISLLLPPGAGPRLLIITGRDYAPRKAGGR